MRRQTWKNAFVGGTVALIVLFGIDIATSGIERIYGPVDGAGGNGGAAIATQPAAERLPENEVAPVQQLTVSDAQHGRTEEEIRREYERKLEEELAKRLPGLPDMRSQSTVNQVADGTAGALQSISSKGIRLVVSFFERVTD
ncbi:hypothetical protein [Paenibacillus sacheonensis]|uniref:Uncharacterized protein n=1 Tax=Paenibacillus sacheonensis TaxID=742054 RepID=A0A7X5BYH7_9BACL|nr:hypothetical protein [Paenibacillus sacheonensis]MBM7565616.1 hypothetical protein [Paenibacillus sacheonensis]NBC69466.1 hypothetical protein [Paenibacillus sacheonensis]